MLLKVLSLRIPSCHLLSISDGIFSYYNVSCYAPPIGRLLSLLFLFDWDWMVKNIYFHLAHGKKRIFSIVCHTLAIQMSLYKT